MNQASQWANNVKHCISLGCVRSVHVAQRWEPGPRRLQKQVRSLDSDRDEDRRGSSGCPPGCLVRTHRVRTDTVMFAQT